METTLSKSYKIIKLLTHALRLYEQGLEDAPGSRDFGAGALWALSCVLNEEDEFIKEEEIPTTFEKLLEKTRTFDFKRRICEGCGYKESAAQAWQILKTAPFRPTIVISHADNQNQPE